MMKVRLGHLQWILGGNLRRKHQMKTVMKLYLQHCSTVHIFSYKCMFVLLTPGNAVPPTNSITVRIFRLFYQYISPGVYAPFNLMLKTPTLLFKASALGQCPLAAPPALHCPSSTCQAPLAGGLEAAFAMCPCARASAPAWLSGAWEAEEQELCCPAGAPAAPCFFLKGLLLLLQAVESSRVNPLAFLRLWLCKDLPHDSYFPTTLRCSSSAPPSPASLFKGPAAPAASATLPDEHATGLLCP